MNSFWPNVPVLCTLKTYIMVKNRTYDFMIPDGKHWLKIGRVQGNVPLNTNKELLHKIHKNTYT